MGSPTRTRSLWTRAGLAAAFAVAFAAGVGVGVLADRTWLRPPADAPGRDPRLVGRWVRDQDRTPLEFKADGTFEYVRVTRFEVPVFGDRPGDVEKKRETAEDRVTGQYRWVDAETVEIREPDLGGSWSPLRFAIEGDRLTLLRTDGGIQRYTRDAPN
jgi:hypothetical protein